jgi:hypothetical protein
MKPTCDYQGYEFGGGYLDSVCIDGFLWDADSGYQGPEYWIYTSGGDIGCPMCNPQLYAEHFTLHLLNDVRKNRGVEPFKPDNAGLRRLRKHAKERGYQHF